MEHPLRNLKSRKEFADFWDTHDATGFEDEFEPVELDFEDGGEAWPQELRDRLARIRTRQQSEPISDEDMDEGIRVVRETRRARGANPPGHQPAEHEEGPAE